MQATSFKPIRKPFIRKIYSGNSLMVGIPRRIAHDLELGKDDYVHLYIDEFNDSLIIKKVRHLEEGENNNV